MVTPPSHTSKGAILLVATMTSFLPPFMSSSINIALPAIGKEFSLDAVTLNWVATSYILASAVFLVPFGRIADIYGRKKVFIYGVIIYTLASALAAVANSTLVLLGARVLQGASAALVIGTSVAILTSAFPAGERGKALGINLAAVYIGLSVGPSLGGFLTQRFGWESIFWLNVPLGVVVLATALLKLKGEWAEARGEKLDIAGSLMYGLALVTIVLGVSMLPDVWGFVLMAFSIIVLLVFIRWESGQKSPIIHVNLFRHNTAFAFSNLAALINYSAGFAAVFLLSLYLQYIKGFSPEQAGIVLISQPVIMAIMAPVAGRLSDRIEPRIVASAGMVFTTTGLLLLVFLDWDTSVGLITASLIISGFGFALFSSPNTNAVMSAVEKQFYGVAAGILGTMRLTGQIFSMGLVLLLFNLYIGRVPITPQYYPLFLQSARTSFVVFTLLCFTGIFASYARGKKQPV